jgi:hypothetical protein
MANYYQNSDNSNAEDAKTLWWMQLPVYEASRFMDQYGFFLCNILLL